MNFSIAMAYFERKRQLLITLGEINKYVGPDDNVTISIVDDGSCEEEKLTKQDIDKFSNLMILYAYMPKESKKHVNPSFPFQIAVDMLKHVKDGVMMLQNPECCWTSNLFEYLKRNIQPNTYYCFACFEPENWNWTPEHNLNDVVNGEGKWLQHSQFSNRQMHFCSAMYKERWDEIGYFDPRLFDGYWYDDDLLIWKIRNAGINAISVDIPMVIHQKHNRFWEENRELIYKNLQIYMGIISGRL